MSMNSAASALKYWERKQEVTANNLANTMHVVRDGAEALDFVFATGRYAGRSLTEQPRVILLDLKLPLVDGLEVLRRIKFGTVLLVIQDSKVVQIEMAEKFRLR